MNLSTPLLAGALFLGGCGSVSLASYDAPQPVERPAVGAVITPPTAETLKPRALDPVIGPNQRLLSALEGEVEAWMGVPYKWGGDDRNGVDCSAFVQNVFTDALGVSIPRTTALQKKEGHSVSRSALAPGDLVFFFTPKRTNHVGVYLGDGDFAHASASRGVMVSNLSEQYWTTSFTQARRLHDLDLTQPAAPEEVTVLEQQQPARPVVVPNPIPASSPVKTTRRRSGW